MNRIQLREQSIHVAKSTIWECWICLGKNFQRWLSAKDEYSMNKRIKSDFKYFQNSLMTYLLLPAAAPESYSKKLSPFSKWVTSSGNSSSARLAGCLLCGFSCWRTFLTVFFRLCKLGMFAAAMAGKLLVAFSITSVVPSWVSRAYRFMLLRAWNDS